VTVRIQRLLATLVAARRGDRNDTRGRPGEAVRLADRLGRDDNRPWTGFGPTNVAIHQVSAAVELGDPVRAVEVGERVDTSAMPAPLVGRRSQVHLDLAWACTHRDQDPLAVLHLLEADRVAPQVLRFNVAARTLLSHLLDREQRAVTPGLRPLATRAGLLA
jgi:hypothetical protein